MNFLYDLTELMKGRFIYQSLTVFKLVGQKIFCSKCINPFCFTHSRVVVFCLPLVRKDCSVFLEFWEDNTSSPEDDSIGSLGNQYISWELRPHPVSPLTNSPCSLPWYFVTYCFQIFVHWIYSAKLQKKCF